MKPYIGQILYSLNVGNAVSTYCQQKLTPVIVTKVGRKYFECQKHGNSWGTRYYIDGWNQVTDYSATSVLYANPDDWEDEKEYSRLRLELRDAVDKTKLSLDQLRAIHSIINNEVEI